MEEIWEDIKGYEGIYQISTFGNVNGKAETKSIHHLVMETFSKLPSCCPTCNTKLEVNHKDFNRSNNRLDNLEYVSREQNVKHSRTRQHLTTTAHPRSTTAQVYRLPPTESPSARRPAPQIGPVPSAAVGIVAPRQPDRRSLPL